MAGPGTTSVTRIAAGSSVVWLILAMIVCESPGIPCDDATSSAGGKVASRQAGRTRAVPRQFTPSQFVFDGVVAIQACRDTTGNGRLDRWEFYEKGKLTRIEEDHNADGHVDWREYYDNVARWPMWHVAERDGEWRFYPQNSRLSGHAAMKGYHHPAGLIRTEKLVEGKWRDTFKDVREYDRGPSPRDGPTIVSETRKYEDGLLQYCEIVGKTWPLYERTDFERGLFMRRVTGCSKEQIWRREVYQDGVLNMTEEDRRHIGRIDWREIHDPQHPNRKRYQKFIDDEWRETFKDCWGTCSADGKDGYAAWYEDGYPVKVEHYVRKTGAIAQRFEYKEGFLLLREEDRDRDGTLDFRTVFKPPNQYESARLYAWRGGKWVSDFVIEGKGYRHEYVDGKMRRTEHGPDPDGNGKLDYLAIMISENETWTGRDGKIDTWYYSGPGGRREKRDLDGDGEPDILFDYTHFTIRRLETTSTSPG